RRLVRARQEQRCRCFSEGWAAKAALLTEAERVRDAQQRAAVERSLRKQQEDAKKVERKRALLDAEVRRLQSQSGYWESRLEQVRYFDALVDSASAEVSGALRRAASEPSLSSFRANVTGSP
ncbi:unnamed protein product, partial [Prorocentrum cordatum]